MPSKRTTTRTSRRNSVKACNTASGSVSGCKCWEKKKLEWADHLSADRRKRLVEPVQDHESLTHSGSQRANHKHMYMLMWLIHQHPWLSHVNFGPKPMQYCKAIILQLNINK